jgi:PadR family transcriptional regulator, regulatory protein AphA
MEPDRGEPGREAESMEPDRGEPGREAESMEPDRGEPGREAERREPDRGEPDRVAGTGLADVEVALLGLLSVRPMTGYEIRHHFDRALAPWWDTPRTQIYPKLRELEARRLIEHEYIVQESKPNKRIYSPTPAGRAQLQDWLRSAIAWPDLRHHMMMRLFLGYLLPASELGELLAEYRDRTAEWAEQLRQIDAKFSRSLSGPYHDAVFFELLSLRKLIDLADHEVTGADQALHVLAQAGDRPPGDKGARVGQLLDIIRDFPG